MTTTIEHVRHRVSLSSYPDPQNDERLAVTVCGRRFVWTTRSNRDTRHHEPARVRCAECWP